MAGDPRHIPLLLGMGLRELSMQPGFLLAAKQRVRECRLADLSRRVAALLARLDDLEPEEVLAALAD
jgi:phosphotransferase system enzyme I (PtsI)